MLNTSTHPAMANEAFAYQNEQLNRRAGKSYVGEVVYQMARFLFDADDKEAASAAITEAVSKYLFIPPGSTPRGILTLIAKRYERSLAKGNTKFGEEV